MTPCSSFKPLRVKKATNLQSRYMWGNCSVPMEVDTGASMSIMSEATYYKLWPRRSQSTTHIRLLTYSNRCIVGSTDVQVSYEDQTAQLPLVVVKGAGPALLGRNWISKNWSNIIH